MLMKASPCIARQIYILMENITAAYSNRFGKYFSIEEVAELLKAYPSHAIDKQPWVEYASTAKVFFNIAYTDETILIRYSVCEKNIRSIYTNSNDPVYKDSCVEFFIALNNERAYYNFEFNCSGTVLAGYGEGKDRELLPTNKLRLIKTYTKIKSLPGSDTPIKWELTVEIPFKVFIKHKVDSFKGRLCRVNFYKCGDDLPEPHFLTWNYIQASAPNFHLPEYFGRLTFNTEI